ncbi:sugar phosphate nucleotidyltransferase, partial [Methylobacterium sp. UNCCL125]|uniref:mannose-1-phosphate guanylyltransferase n=2 Tax=unclassified Methylobacterium TaxID=2615210 RepID=UPI0008E68CD2
MQDWSERVLPVILCGGTGTRLWPASRESMPKQFARLVDAERSTFQATLARVSDTSVFAKATVIASAEARFIVAEQRDQLGLAADILLEPQGRDSAAAVAVAALHAAAADPQAVVLILAADHVVPDTVAFVDAVRRAAAGARAGYTMTLGIEPDRPATDYGYIRRGEPIAEAPGAARVARFVEKPDRAGAEALITDGALWNSGYFLFRADLMLAELEAFVPEVLAAARAALEAAVTDLDFVRLDAAAFAQAPKISIDYAVMERTARAGVLPVSFSWSDVGTWDAVWQVLDHDAEGNAVRGRVSLIGTKNSLVHSQGEGLTAVVGL